MDTIPEDCLIEIYKYLDILTDFWMDGPEFTFTFKDIVLTQNQLYSLKNLRDRGIRILKVKPDNILEVTTGKTTESGSTVHQLTPTSAQVRPTHELLEQGNVTLNCTPRLFQRFMEKNVNDTRMPIGQLCLNFIKTLKLTEKNPMVFSVDEIENLTYLMNNITST